MTEDTVSQDQLLASMRNALSRITEDNKARWAEFARLAGPPGMVGLQLDLLNIRVFTLARMVFGDESHALAQFQIEYETQVSQVLDQATAQVRQAQLGAQLSPQAVQQLAKDQGLLGPDGKPLVR